MSIVIDKTIACKKKVFIQWPILYGLGPGDIIIKVTLYSLSHIRVQLSWLTATSTMCKQRTTCKLNTKNSFSKVQGPSQKRYACEIIKAG